MRLRQLSRKLDVDTEKIIRHLQACNLPCEDDSNAKLSDEQVAVLIEKFGPINETEQEETATTVTSVEKLQEATTEPIAEAEEKIEEEEEEVVPSEIQTTEVLLSQSTSTPSLQEEVSSLEPEVIRAPKVELTGLKVVGKIELRTAKKKEESEGETTTDEKTAQPKINRARSNGKHPLKNHARKSTLTIAEQREREEKIKQRKKNEAEKQAKKKKRENYLKKVKTKEKTEAKKVKIGGVVESKQQSKPKENVGLITKFINWMRRE